MKIIMIYCREFCLILSLTLLAACASDPLSLASGDSAFKEWFFFFSPSPGKGLLTAYSDEFDAPALDTDKWHERLNGWRDQNPPVPWAWGTISPQVIGGELILTPEPSPNADWWNHWYGPGLFSNDLDWSAGEYQIDLQVSFTPYPGASQNFVGLIIQDVGDEFHYVKFVCYGPDLYDINICRGPNPWPTAGWAHYLNPTTDLNIPSGGPLPGYDSITRPQDEEVDFHEFVTDIFAVFVQHTRHSNNVVIRVISSGGIVTMYYSEDGGANFFKGMSGCFHPAAVRIGMVANQMGAAMPFGGDGKAHFDYIRVYRR